MFRHRHNHAAGVVALALALAISATPVAWADPPPLAKAESAIVAGSSQANTPVLPNPDEQIVTGATAHAGPCSEICSGGSYGYVSKSSSTPTETLGSTDNSASHPASVVHVVAPGHDFDWGDAAIGAGAALVLVGVGLGAARAVTNTRKGRPIRQRASTSS